MKASDQSIIESIEMPLKAEHMRARELNSLLGETKLNSAQQSGVKRKARELRDGLDAIRTTVRNAIMAPATEPLRHRLASDELPLCDTKENPLSYAAFDLKVTCRACLIIEALQARVVAAEGELAKCAAGEDHPGGKVEAQTAEIAQLQARVEQLVKDAPPAAQVERWKKLEADEKTLRWELREAYRAAKMVDDASWGEFCGCCGALLSLESRDEECGPMHTAAQLTHEWVERNKALGAAVRS